MQNRNKEINDTFTFYKITSFFQRLKINIKKLVSIYIIHVFIMLVKIRIMLIYQKPTDRYQMKTTKEYLPNSNKKVTFPKLAFHNHNTSQSPIFTITPATPYARSDHRSKAIQHEINFVTAQKGWLLPVLCTIIFLKGRLFSYGPFEFEGSGLSLSYLYRSHFRNVFCKRC